MSRPSLRPLPALGRFGTVLLIAGLATLASAAPAHAASKAALPRADATPVDVTTVAASSRPLFTLPNPQLDEISGAVVGQASPGVLYAQNDSGDSARFFALNASTGALIATCTVPGAKNVDWEDMAGGRDASGTASIFIGDIGDNDSVRSSITIYQVAEPQLAPDRPGQACSTPVLKSWTLTYPDGPQNAESLLYAPTSHRLYVVTKTFTGVSQIYQAPTEPGSETQTLVEVGQIELTATTTPGGPVGYAGSVLVTGGAISGDGTLLALRTYTDGYLWRVAPGAAGSSDDGVATALKTDPVRFALPQQPQGEGIAFTGVTGAVNEARQVALIIDSEKKSSTVYAVDVSLPVAANPTRPASATATFVPDGRSLSSLKHSPNRTPRWITLAVALVVVVGAAAALTARRRGRRP